MVKEVKKTSWPGFCKEFNKTNQYRNANITIIDKNNRESGLSGDLPFLGISLGKKGRSIDSIKFFAGRWDPDKIAEPILAIKEPEKIMLEKNAEGSDFRLWVSTKEGSKARIELQGERNPDLFRSLVEKVAYSIFEKRGYSTGNDMNDWFEAERVVRKTETELTK